jgi:hypothetical protein
VLLGRGGCRVWRAVGQGSKKELAAGPGAVRGPLPPVNETVPIAPVGEASGPATERGGAARALRGPTASIERWAPRRVRGTRRGRAAASRPRRPPLGTDRGVGVRRLGRGFRHGRPPEGPRRSCEAKPRAPPAVRAAIRPGFRAGVAGELLSFSSGKAVVAAGRGRRQLPARRERGGCERSAGGSPRCGGGSRRGSAARVAGCGSPQWCPRFCSCAS